MPKRKSIFLYYFSFIVLSFLDFLASDSKLVWVPVIGTCG